MNNKIKFLFLIIVIALLFLIRIIVYNNRTKRISEVRENFNSRSNSQSNKMALELNNLNRNNTPNYILNILENPILVYSSIFGEIVFITHENILIL